MPIVLHGEIIGAVLFVFSPHPQISTPLDSCGLRKWISYITKSQRIDTN